LQHSTSVLKRRVFHIFLILVSIASLAKGQSATITVKGNAVNSQGLGGLYQVIVINQRTSSGMLAEPNGSFSFNCLKTDTILVSASGFGVKKICFLDSAFKAQYKITVMLDSIHYSLAEVKVYPHKNLREVNDERSTLGDIQKTDKYQDINAIGSPIEYLYERFSRIEQSKRKVAQLEDDEKRRDVLKELFHIYIQHDIINLSDDDFEKFIDFCNFTDNFIKTSTDYDLVMAIKEKYEQFEKKDDYVSPYRKQ
jgi:hypothetical protein